MCTLRAICLGHWLYVDWMIWVFGHLIFRIPYDINPCLVKLVPHLEAVIALCWLLTFLCRKLQILCVGTCQSALVTQHLGLPRLDLKRLVLFPLAVPDSALKVFCPSGVDLMWGQRALAWFFCCGSPAFFAVSSPVFLTPLSKMGWLSSSFAGALFYWCAGVFCTRTVLGSPVVVWCDTVSGIEILWYFQHCSL